MISFVHRRNKESEKLYVVNKKCSNKQRKETSKLIMSSVRMTMIPVCNRIPLMINLVVRVVKFSFKSCYILGS